MDTVNHTPFPAQVFEAVDQYDQQFQVFVLRQTLSFGSGTLEYADRQEPLCAAESYFGEGTTGGVRQESDYCPHKPKCDVIVNATAHALKIEAVPQFLARLRVMRGRAPKDAVLIDKTLRITGERHFKERFWPVRLVQWFIKWGTFTLVRPSPWKLTRPRPFNSLPVRASYAYGGECRIDQGDKFARWVPKAYRLTPEQLASHPDAGRPASKVPVAHTVFEPNPAGIGYAPHWYLRATLQSKVPAPRIELQDARLTAKQFWRAQKLMKNSVEIEPAGFGIRNIRHPARRALLGNASNAFAHTKAPLPEDFDFGIWNAAPPDQQVDTLTGGDRIELVNLCPADTPGMRQDGRSNNFFLLTLPEHECFVRLQAADGVATTRALAIDTVLIEPEDYALTLVWRMTLPKEEVADIQTCEFRMCSFSDRDGARHDLAAHEYRQAREMEAATGEAAP